MSREYDEYLKEHIGAVGKAANWMVDNLPSVYSMSDHDLDTFMRNVRNHDQSKMDDPEYGPYDDYFYGIADEEAFNRAWLHHIHNNPHHWQHWLLMQDDGKYRDPDNVIALEMPRVYALEMIADWWSFSWRSGNLHEVFDWYEKNKDNIILHEATRTYVETVLAELRVCIGGAE